MKPVRYFLFPHIIIRKKIRVVIPYDLYDKVYEGTLSRRYFSKHLIISEVQKGNK